MEQEKNNTFSWVLRFATQCKGKMAASVLLAVLGSVCGIVPYFAVSQIVIQICGQTVFIARDIVHKLCSLSAEQP